MNQLTVKEAAKLLNVHECTVRNLERAGKLRGFRDHRNYRIFTETEVLRVKIKREQLHDKP